MSSAYDQWLEAPYTDVDEGEECPDCGGTGADPNAVAPEDLLIRLKMNGEGVRKDEECETCDGLGQVPPPTREEIKERIDEMRFDQLHEEGRI